MSIKADRTLGDSENRRLIRDVAASALTRTNSDPHSINVNTQPTGTRPSLVGEVAFLSEYSRRSWSSSAKTKVRQTVRPK
jgi:hypothetical protein